MLRGLLLRLFSFAVFFLMLAAGLNRLGIAVALPVAIGMALMIQGLTLRAIRSAGDGPTS